MTPIVSIVGKSKSGKTTLIEKLTHELKSRGYRIATIKHAAQGIDFNDSGKDSWRHIQAGSEATVTSSPDKIVLIKPITQDITLDKIAHLLGDDCDVILTEGFKQSNMPKIETHLKETGPPLTAVKNLMAIVTDEPLQTETKQFSPRDIKDLADLIENGFILPHKE